MPNPIAPEKIAALRFHRQKLAEPVQTEQEYRELFRMLSPVMTPIGAVPATRPVFPQERLLTKSSSAIACGWSTS